MKDFIVEIQVGGMKMNTVMQWDDGVTNEQGAISDLSKTMWIMVQAAAQVQHWAVSHGNMRGVLPSLDDVDRTAQFVPQQYQAQPEKKDEPKVIPVTKIAHEYADGKHRYKIFGGDYTKFGVDAYSDSCVDGVGVFAKELGDHLPDKPMVAIVQMKKDGNPYRVTEIKYVSA